MNDNKRMTSIARRINISFWFKRFWDLMGFNLIMVCLAVGSFVYWRYEQVPENENVYSMYFTSDNGYDGLEFICVTKEGNEYSYQVKKIGDYLIVPGIALVSLELVHLILALFGTADIRKKLKPLNDLAVKAEQISALPLDMSKFESLEHAIENISPDSPNARISTGDKDLQSIEVALNNLLQRMKETQKQQSRFVSDASHELRTPISVIQGYVNMLDRWGKEDEKILEESIDALKQESMHMNELVEQLLFLARGDSGRNTLHYSVFDLNEIIKEVWEESLMIDEKHVYRFINDNGNAVDDEGCIHNPPAVIKGDIAMVKQSVRIFVQNAAKYSRDGDAITFRVKTMENEVCYEIQDEGIGMYDSDMIHIFERFYRTDEARNNQTGGSGLGLSIAKWIVDAHNGTISVLSRPEFGTRFTVTLPMYCDDKE